MRSEERTCVGGSHFGDPIRPEELLYEPRRSLIEQSRRSGPDAGIANADGFGLGWYGLSDRPGLFRSSLPAWGDQNLRELSAQIRSPLFLAHVRAASAGMPVQQTNCHPFKHGSGAFVHNGFIADSPHLRRELTMAVDPCLYPCIEGSTDYEVMFYLALTFGLDDDPLGALERMTGFVEAPGSRTAPTPAADDRRTQRRRAGGSRPATRVDRRSTRSSSAHRSTISGCSCRRRSASGTSPTRRGWS